MYQLYNKPELICFVSVQTHAKFVFDVNFNNVWGACSMCMCVCVCVFQNISRKNTFKDLLPSVLSLGSC